MVPHVLQNFKYQAGICCAEAVESFDFSQYFNPNLFNEEIVKDQKIGLNCGDIPYRDLEQ